MQHRIASFPPEDRLANRGLALELLDDRLVKRLARPSLMSSAHGALRCVLLAIPSWIVRYERQPEIRSTGAAVRSLLKQLPDSTEFVLITHDEAVDPMRVLLDQTGVLHRTRVIAASNKMKFGSWVQDGFVVCREKDRDSSYLVEPVPYRSPDDAHAVGIVARSTSLGHTQVPLCFEGGNMLVGDDFWLLGMDSAVQTYRLGLIERHHGESRQGALHREFAERLDANRRLHLIGSRIPVPGFTGAGLTKKIAIDGKDWSEQLYRGNHAGTTQPIFHIDAFISLAGRNDDGVYTVLVGDPAMAAELLGNDLPHHAMRPVFDDIADQLTLLGFQVVRNPLPLLYHDDEINRVRSWYFATSNNAVVQIADGSRSVWLPTYASEKHPELESTDQANTEIWRRLGFETFALEDFNGFARHLGAAHCITKCLARGT